MSQPPPPPDHMNRESRTQRLYDNLKAMGLYVSPIYFEGEIDSLHVAVDLPKCSPEDAAEAGIVTPMQRSEVGETIRAAEDCRDTVINFPAPH